MNELFFQLIQVALGTREILSRTPSKTEWDALFDIAEKHALIGICFIGIHNLGADTDGGYEEIGMSEDMFYEWMGTTAIIQQRNELVNKQCCEISNRLEHDGLEHCIMKGQQVGRYYNELASLRQPGDIDVWVKGGMRKVVDYVQNIAPTKSMSHQHVHLNVFDETSVEMHYIPAELHCPWYDKRLNVFLSTNSQFIKVQDDELQGGIYVPSDEFNIMHLTAHAFRHLFGEGMSIRQLMDLYFVLMEWDSNDKMKRDIFSAVKSCGMGPFLQAIMFAMGKVFAMPEDKMICDKRTKAGELLLKWIMDDSNAVAAESRRLNNRKEPAISRFIRIQLQNIKLIRIAPMEVIWVPFWRIWNWCWMRRNGYKYHD